MACLVGWVPLRKISPPRPGLEHPENTIEHIAFMPARTATTVEGTTIGRYERSEKLPLLIGKMHIPFIISGDY